MRSGKQDRIFAKGDAMEFDTQVKLAIYRSFAEAGRRPSPEDVTDRVDDLVREPAAGKFSPPRDEV